MNKNIFSFLAALTGVVFAICLPMGIYFLENYYSNLGLTEFLVWAFRGLLSFILGVYLVSILRWILSKKEKDIVPPFVILGAMIGGVAGLIISIPVLVFWLRMVMVVLFVFFGIRFSFKFEKDLTKNIRKRVLLSSIGLFIIALPLFALIRGLGFPRNAPISVRHECALRNLEYHYPAAVEFIKNIPEIISDVGYDISVAPSGNITARNTISNALDTSFGFFILEVKGSKGKGVCEVQTRGLPKNIEVSNIEWRSGDKRIQILTEKQKETRVRDLDLEKFDTEQLKFSLEEARRLSDGEVLINKSRGRGGKIDSDKLESLLREKREMEEKSLIEEYSKLKKNGDIGALFIAFEEEAPRICPAPSVKVIASMGEPAVKPLIDSIRKIKEKPGWPNLTESNVCWAMEKIGEPAVKPLENALKDVNEDVRAMAVMALGQIGNKSMIDMFVRCLEDPSAKVRANAAVSLGRLKDVRGLEPLLVILKNDESSRARTQAANALGEIQDTRAVEPLISSYSDKSLNVRCAVVSALGNLGDNHSIDLLISALSDENSRLRQSAVYALKNFKNPRTIEALIERLQDENKEVAQAVRFALQQITGEWSCYSQICWQEWWKKNKDNFSTNK